MNKCSKPALPLVMLVLAMLLLSACAAGNTAQTTNSSANGQQSDASQSTIQEKAVEIENMGVKMVFPEAPKRAVTLNQHATEVMLALGLESSMVGTAYLDDQILPKYKTQYDKIPVLAKQYPSKEVFMAAAPDFAYAGWKSAFNDKNLGSREELAQQGVQTYVQESSNKPGPILEDVYRDILNIGRIFRVEERAEKLVNDIRAQVQSIQTQIGTVERAPKVFVYDSGEDKPFTAANNYLTSLIKSVKAKNIFDDIDKSFTEVSWEEVVNRNPDVIIILDYGDTSLADKEKLLLSKPALAGVEAIKNKRFVVLPLSAAAEGVRAPIALKTLAAGLYPDKVK
ncbi:ABC transporter substrate-binding protein [Paenibacillus polymyxa]|uniref:ABC transporter substrate-binding protein n=1 Tax=Paenibacillus TaxID=44249 RepID=UPI0002FF3658|nr:MULTISPECIES: ABC transporter substrate-binding protein [Paenibacillus]AUS26462.1 Fe3+-hydroxamate ABC transporter substrate-binding protein [Paenibacillus polymyxa]KAF6651081.1 ABC transporter substrate-binding protein [Paenibacillus sp. EKM301P]KJK28208.1 Fe3+-hydroxamate ABC transporter substrate-binding protein [Paenibacillus polymyxa]KKD52402.1 Fe3+-hydroxamate ABC transporter substrate-binding protein [Paenibacillus sp. ICGEB2008]MEE4580109.1 ABC transporter substrate-binding protein 